MKLLSKLDKYIIAKYLGTYFFSIALIISIAVVFDFNEHIDRFVDAQIPLGTILFDYYIYFIPYYSNLFSQLFVFISVIFFTSKLAENTEIIAMISSGVTTRRLLRPYLISAAFICLLSLYLGTIVIPRGNVKRVKFENTYKRRRPETNISNVQLLTDNGVVAYIGHYEGETKTGYEFTLDQFKNKKLVKHLEANTIEYDTLSEVPGHWIIKNYRERDLHGMQEVITTGERMDSALNIQPQDFLITRDQQTTLTSPQLLNYITRQKERGSSNIKTFEVEYHQRYASAFAAFILTVIGFSLSAKKRKNGMGIALGAGLILSVLYILFQTISSTFAINANVPPMIAVWIPNIVFLFIAIFCFRFAPK